MTDIIDLAEARRISDERDQELREICREMTQAGHTLADSINVLRDAILGGCDGETLVTLARAVADADTRMTELSERGWACGHRRLVPESLARRGLLITQRSGQDALHEQRRKIMQCQRF